MDLRYFEVNAKALRESLRKYSTTADREDFSRWLDTVLVAIAELESGMRRHNLNRAEKQKFQTCMVQFLSMRCQLQSLLEFRGGELRGEASDKDLPKISWEDFDSAFENRIKSGVIVNLAHLDILEFLKDAKSLFITKITSLLNDHSALKVNTELASEYMVLKDGAEELEVKFFNTENNSIYESTDLDEWFEINVGQPLQNQIESFEGKGSGWSLVRILRLVVNSNRLNRLRASSYIPLPPEIISKRACVNVKNEDDACFKWSVLAGLHPVDVHPDRVSHYKQYENTLNFENIGFPMSLKNMNRFERQNSISVNVYILKKCGKNYSVSPVHLTSHKEEKHVNLLMIQNFYEDENQENEESNASVIIEESITYHYVLIKNLSRLVRSQLTSSKKKCFICDRCMCFFMSEERLKQHEIDCSLINKCKIQMPSEKDKFLKFTNFNHCEKIPWVVYSDFESLLIPVSDDKDRAFQQHQAYSVGFYLKCAHDDSLSRYEYYRQTNETAQSPAEWFVDKLRDLCDQIEKSYKDIKPMNLTPEELESFNKAKVCHICKLKFKDTDVKVRDHSHMSGRYRGAAHQQCNMKYQESRMIPVIYHNLAYDLHFLIRELATSAKLEGRVQLLAENKEKYISFTKYVKGSDINFRFIDSFRFMPSSLEKLASYLDEKTITTREFLKDGYTMDQIHLLLRKGIYPYDFTSSFDKLEVKELPSKEEFYNKLNDTDVSDEDYQHAKNVWGTFNIDTLGSYSDLYLKQDICLLVDIYENFRTTCMEAYGLDPAHYFTTPGLTFDAMLKYTNITLELLTDVDMLLFIERGIRGGMSQCSHRYAKANNRYMGDKYNPEEEESFIIYLDANNLYGWSMSQHLPTGGFTWVENVDEPEFWNVPDDSPLGYILEVSLHYPEGLHDAHIDIPLCPEHMCPPGSKQAKLLTTLYDKDRYVIHYRALKQALKHGLVLKKIYRALQFRQSPFLKSYVDLNTEKRKQSKNEFEKMFFKLLINAIYGKCMENERKRLIVKLVFKWLGRYSAEALISKPNFHSRAIFDENLVAIQLSHTEITIRKPIYIGLCVLDISKTLMFDFNYSFMKERFGDKCQMMYTDTDSFIYHIRGINIYEVIKDNIEKFDTSDYPEDNQFGIPRKNKKVIGLFKDEACSKIIESFIGLRSKMYSIKIQGEDPIKKAKGVKTRVVKNKIFFEDYEECLFNQTIKKVHQNTIRSRLHVVRTEKQEKIALSPHDDKRHLLPNETRTLPWGHWSILDEDLMNEFATEHSSKFSPETSPNLSEHESNSTALEHSRSMEVVEQNDLEEEILGNFENVVEVGVTLHKEQDSTERFISSADQLEESPPSKKQKLN